MKKEHKYWAALGLLLVALVLVEYLAPDPLDWTVTFYEKDRNPFGAFVLNETIDDIFPEHKTTHYYNSLYEIRDSIRQEDNIIILGTQFYPDSLDTEVLLDQIKNGGHALIAANYFGGQLADTLQLKTGFSFKEFIDEELDGKSKQDSFALNFVNSALQSDSGYLYQSENIPDYFESFDTTKTTILAVNGRNLPVFVKVDWGQGALFLSSVPLTFSNYYLLYRNNNEFVAKSLSYLPNENLHWIDYYHLGRLESPSPLRFILKTAPLRWALYISLLLLLIFIIFEAKRKQRYIPIVTPPVNSSMEFVKIVSRLFYRNRHHKNIADKKIIYFLDYIRSHYHIPTEIFDEAFRERLAKKSGKERKEVDKLIDFINQLQKQPQVSEKELFSLNQQIESFYYQGLPALM